MASNEDGLFLLEVLVDKISFREVPCFADKDFRTCINVSCVAVESLEICDDDPTSCVAKSGGPFVKSFNAGKSCLFSLKSGEISSAMSKFPIKVVVSKSLACGCLPTKVVLGEATIDMTKEFVQARNKYNEDPSCISYQALKDVFRLTHEKKETGEISMFLRISCFGKSIVTKFQASNSGQVTLGASRHSSGHDRSCNPARKYQTLDEPCVCGMGSGPSGPGSGGTSVCKAGGRSGGYGVCPPGEETYNSRPCSEPDDPCYCTGPKEPYKSPLVCRNVDKYCLHIPKGRSKLYEEIGTNLAGNELKIKVPVGLAVIKKISQTHCSFQSPYQHKKKGRDDNGPCNPPCALNQISLAIPSEGICCRGPQLADTQFTCTTEGCTETAKHGQVLGMARGDNNKTSTTPKLPNNDVFVLKVGKTAVQGDRKCKLELELVAPKAGDKRLPIQTANERIQSDNCPCCPCQRPRLKLKRKGRHCAEH